MAKPKDEVHVSCLADSHLAWRGRARNFSKSRGPLYGEKAMYDDPHLASLRSSGSPSLYRLDFPQSQRLYSGGKLGMFSSPRAYIGREGSEFFQVSKRM